MQWEITRTQPAGPARGYAIPAFIHNWHYYYSPLEVYGDGLVECWSSVDLGIFRRKLNQGWVVTNVPVGASVSIHNLGGAIVRECEWTCRPADLLNQVEAAVDLLNPSRIRLIDLHGEEDVEVRGKFRRSKLSLPDGRPYRIDAQGKELIGDSVPVFLRTVSEFYLTSWFIYADGSSRVGTSEEISSVIEVASRLDDGDLCTFAPTGARINIQGLGWFEAQESFWDVKPEERVREVQDMLAKLNGNPGSIQVCRDAFREYEADSSPSNLDRLRSAYEAVPEHLRNYCGDMDSRDIPIRKVLYGEDPIGEL